MSYEYEMLQKYDMPTRGDVEKNLLIVLFWCGGAIKEFSSDEKIVNQIAEKFKLSEEQKTVPLKRIYKKENRIVRTPLWHRLLYRAGDALAKEKLVTRPTTTLNLTNQKEWMLTEQGYDKVLDILNIPKNCKEELPVKSFEVQKVIKRISQKVKPVAYKPFDKKRNDKVVTKDSRLRARGFRQAVIEIYDHECSVCGLKLGAPNKLQWEVQAAHIVPHSHYGKDDVWNGLALCRLHHWAFDVGLFSFSENFKLVSALEPELFQGGHGMIFDFCFLDHLKSNNCYLKLPKETNHYPDVSAINWHRKNIYAHRREISI